MPGELKPSVKMSREFGLKPPRHHGADVVDMDEAGAPGDEPSVVVDRRHQVNVRGVQRRRVGAVGEEHVALADVALEAADHRLAGLGSAGQMVEEAHAPHEKRAVGPIEGRP